MAKLGLDLKHFKKIAEDKHSTTLQHKAGHQMKIIHSALSKEMHEGLKALPMMEKPEAKVQHYADGTPDVEQPSANTEVDPSANSTPVPTSQDMPKDFSTTQAPQAPQTEAAPTQEQPEAPKAAPVDPTLAEKRALYNSIVSGDIGSQAAKAGTPNADQGTDAQFGPNGEAPKAFNAQAWNQAEQNFNAKNAADATQVGVQTAKIIEDNKARQAAGLPQLPVPAAPGAQPGGDQGPANAPAAPATPGAQQDTLGLQGYSEAFHKGQGAEEAGIQGQAKAEAALGTAQSKILGDQLQAQHNLQSITNRKLNETETEYNNFVHDVQSQHIDPKHYFNSLDTGAKIATGIGLILGGMGSGITGGENPALAMLNRNIDRDVAAQQANLGKSENLLSANLKHFGNIKDAAAMTQAMQAGIVINQLKQAEANAQDPLAKARAQQAIGSLYMDKVAPALRQIGMTQAMMHVMGGAGSTNDIEHQIATMRVVNPAMAKSMEERYVPGVGVSSVPVPQAVRDTLVAKQQLNNMGQDFYNWASKHSGSLDPRTIAEGKTKAAELQSMYRNSINGGVFKKGEQEFIDNIIDSDPTKFFNSIRVLPKLKEVINNNAQQFKTLRDGSGIKPLPSAQGQQQAGGFTPKTFKPNK